MNAKTNKIITNGDDLNKHILSVGKSARALEEMIQVGLASAAYQLMHGRNTNHLNALMLQAGKGVRKTAMAAWALAFMPVMLETDKDKMKEQPFRFDAQRVGELLAKHGIEVADDKNVSAETATTYATIAYGTMWTEHKEPPLVPESWSLSDAIAKVIKQAKDMTGKNVKVTGADMLGQLEALVRKDSGIQSV